MIEKVLDDGISLRAFWAAFQGQYHGVVRKYGFRGNRDSLCRFKAVEAFLLTDDGELLLPAGVVEEIISRVTTETAESVSGHGDSYSPQHNQPVG